MRVSEFYIFRESIEEGVLKSRDEIWITSKLASVWMDPTKIMSAVQVRIKGVLGGLIRLLLCCNEKAFD